MKAKICFFLTKAYPLFAKVGEDIGGAEINLYYLSTQLAKNPDLSVSFLVGDFGQPTKLEIEGVTLIKIKYLNEKLYSGLIYKFFRRFSFWYQLWRTDADVYLSTAASEFCGYLIFICKILKRKKVLFRVAHDWDVNGKFTKQMNLTGILYRFALKRFDKIICQTSDQKVLLRDTEGLDSSVIKNGFPIENVNKSQRPSRSFILWVARPDYFKRPLLFLELALRIPSEKFVMIIPEANDLTNRIILESKNIANLEIVGHVSFFDIRQYFQEAKCFVNTSESEGFPNTFIQSWLNGTPILSFRVDPEGILRKEALGFCCMDDMNAAIDFINNLDDEKIDFYATNGLSYLRKNHDLNEKSSQYLYTINELLKFK